MIKRKEEIGDCTLYLADCLDVLPTLGKVDAVVTDPPYGISHPCNFEARGRGNLAGKRMQGGKPVWVNPSSNNYPDVHGDNSSFDPAPWLEVGSAHIFWGGNYFADRLPPSGGWLVWDKERPDTLDQATCELAWTDCIKGVRRLRYLWNGMMRAGERGENYHPTQKAVAVMRWALEFKWVPRGTVLDPFMGSGTTGVACVQLGRKFVGIEIDPTYFDIACERISAAERQGDMFLEKPEQTRLEIA